MSLLIPRETIDVLRQHINVVMGMVGITATLYIPTDASLLTVEGLDVFETNSTTSNLLFNSYTSLVFIEWNPSKYRLRKLGIFTEGELPILVWIPLNATVLDAGSSEVGTVVEVDVTTKSYIRITPEFIPGDTTDIQEFEVVDLTIKGTHDAVILKGAKCVPRRIQIEDPTP